MYPSTLRIQPTNFGTNPRTVSAFEGIVCTAIRQLNDVIHHVFHVLELDTLNTPGPNL